MSGKGFATHARIKVKLGLDAKFAIEHGFFGSRRRLIYSDNVTKSAASIRPLLTNEALLARSRTLRRELSVAIDPARKPP